MKKKASLKKKTSKKKRILLTVLCIVIILLVAGDWALAAFIYGENFNKRFESYEPLMLYIDDFDGLGRTQYKFSSDKGRFPSRI